MFDLGMASLLLGAAGTGFGAFSQQQAASRQRDLYNRYSQQQQLMQNPAYQISQAQPYYQANLAAMRQQLPAFMRSQVNPMLAIQGLDPAGGAARQITEQAIAPQISGAWQNALNTVQGQNTAAMGGLAGMGQNIGQPYGQVGGLANSLQSLMMMKAMQRYNQPQQTAMRGTADTTGLSGGAMSYGGQDPNMGMSQFGIKQDPYFNDPYGAGYMFGNTPG